MTHPVARLVLAHGVGEVRGLPLPGELVLQTGGVVVLFSFLAVALLWRVPRFAGPDTARNPVPATPAGGEAGVAGDAAPPGPAPLPRESPPLSARVGTFDSPSVALVSFLWVPP